MDQSTVALVVLVAALIVQAALLLLREAAHQRAEREHALERQRLQNLVTARDPREFAVLQKASKQPKEEPRPEAREHEPLIGTY